MRHRVKRRTARALPETTVLKVRMIPVPHRAFSTLAPHLDPEVRLRIMEEYQAARLGLERGGQR